MLVRLKGSKSPNLPIGPVEYAQRYQDQLNNILRLYFNEVDNITATVLSDEAGEYLTFPHIGASDSTDQYATANNTPTIVKWNTLDAAHGFTLNPPGTATATYSAVYKIDYSLQLVNTANAAHDVVIWLKINNADVPNSATKFTVPSRKSAGVPSFLCAYSSIVFEIDEGDTIALYWATEQAYNPVGPVDGIYMEHLPVQTVPYPHPAAPSAVGSITYLSRRDT